MPTQGFFIPNEPRVNITLNITYPPINLPIITTTRLDFITILPVLNLLDENGDFQKIDNNISIKDKYEINVNNQELINLYKNGFLLKKFFSFYELYSFFSVKNAMNDIERYDILRGIINIKNNRPLSCIARLLDKAPLNIIFVCVDLGLDQNGNYKYRNNSAYGVDSQSADNYIRNITHNIELGEENDIFLELGLRSSIFEPIHNFPQGNSNQPIYKANQLITDSKIISERIIAEFIKNTTDIICVLDGNIVNHYDNDVLYHSSFINNYTISEPLMGEKIITLHGWYKDINGNYRVNILPASFLFASTIIKNYNNRKPFISTINVKMAENFDSKLIKKQRNEDVFNRLFDIQNNASYYNTRVNALFNTRDRYTVLLTDFTRNIGNNVLKQENAVRAAYKTKKWLKDFLKKLIGLRRKDINYESIIEEVRQKIAPIYADSNISYDIVIDPEKNIFDNYLYIDFILRVGINIHRVKLEIDTNL